MRRVLTGTPAAEASASLSSPRPPPLDPRCRIEGGVDEAGYGPLLGPLCVGSVAIECPESAPDLWSRLRGAVGKSGDDLPVVADSKTIYPGPGGFGRLERTALAFTALGGHSGRIPATIAEFLETCPGNSLSVLARHPWYSDLDAPLPRAVPRRVIEEDVRRLEDRCEAGGARVRMAEARVVPEIEFNEAVRRAGNKAEVMFALAAEAVGRIATLPGHGAARILVDRLGGRRFYAPGLARRLPEFLPTPLREGRRRSCYRLQGAARGALLEFAIGGEARAFPCALASILAKYARELLVERLNAHFARRAPGLRPTAGYVQDGRRFLEDLRHALPAEEVPLHLLVRSR